MTANLMTLRRALHHDGVDQLPCWTPGIGHLDRCRSADSSEPTCPTCEMHALTPTLTDLLAMLDDIDALVDARRVASVLVAHADRVARRGLPPLATQPEWEMLPATPPQCEPTSRDTLEALVAESIADEVLERAMAIAASLAALPGRRVIRRPPPAVAMSSPARSLVWRRATINWPLSLADTGLVTCWRPALTADHLRLSVPFGSAIGLTSDVADGRTVSALHTSA